MSWSPKIRALKLLFMGSAEFAVPSLAALCKARCKIVGVFTAPDRPKGRGRRIAQTDVKQYAEAHRLNVYQPLRLRAAEVRELLEELQPDLQVVVAFRKLPREVWSFPQMGTINLHAALLPAYRGAAPIQWALMNGETKTGLSTFFIREEIDTGPMLLQEETAIAPDDNFGRLHERMSQQGADLLLRTLSGLVEGNLEARLQPSTSSDLPTAPKIDRSTCEIDWKRPAEEIEHQVRALDPRPGAWTLFRGEVCKIFRTQRTHEVQLDAGAQLLRSDGIFFGTETETLSIEELQLSGKRRLSVVDFIHGLRI